MPRNYNMMAVSKEKFLKVIKHKGLSMSGISHNFGRSTKFIANGLDNGKFTQSTVKMLEMFYNISYDDIKPDEPNDTKNQKEKLDMKELYSVVYSAVYEAVKLGVKDALNS